MWIRIFEASGWRFVVFVDKRQTGFDHQEIVLLLVVVDSKVSLLTQKMLPQLSAEQGCHSSSRNPLAVAFTSQDDYRKMSSPVHP
jgi:hypothetical protein